MAANPFGREAMNKGENSRVVVEAGESLRLRYGVWIHSGEASSISSNINRARDAYLELFKR